MAEGTSEAGGLELLRRFVSLQAELVKAWMQFHPEALDPWAAKRIPRHGELTVRGERWRFQRHGAGVGFQGEESRWTVEVHRAVGTPEVFDAWRLMVYFESLNVNTVRMGARDFPTDDERSLEQWLVALEGLGLVERERSGVRMWRLTRSN
ncbi:MAG: DUF6896 domain-containing protein [Hyalangium sp.]|uniref:DUF6896 domain-containing protein n=1 Tax=Hyalangium sp. TaxID=2028555 RepID=UPI003899EE9F